MHIIAGLALGLVIGFFTGLSVSPVVAAFLTTLSSLLFAFLSLHKTDPSRGALLRLTGFGLGCVLAGALGVYLRANNVLGLTPARAVAQWRQAGIKEEEIVALIKTQLQTELARGRSLGELALMAPAEFTAEAQAAPVKKKGGESSRAAEKITRPPWGIGGFFSQEEVSAIDSLLDQLRRNPPWEDARSETLRRLQFEPSALAWLDALPVEGKEKVLILRALVEDSKKRSVAAAASR